MYIYPFSAIVGQEDMKLALILNAIQPAIGGVLIRGEKGTAKSTAVRALATVLPELAVVSDCPFSCPPDQPEAMCDSCRTRLEQGKSLPTVQRRMRVVDLPINASEDRVVGTLDLEYALREGRRRFEPGFWPRQTGVFSTSMRSTCSMITSSTYYSTPLLWE